MGHHLPSLHPLSNPDSNAACATVAGRCSFTSSGCFLCSSSFSRIWASAASSTSTHQKKKRLNSSTWCNLSEGWVETWRSYSLSFQEYPRYVIMYDVNNWSLSLSDLSLTSLRLHYNDDDDHHHNCQFVNYLPEVYSYYILKNNQCNIILLSFMYIINSSLLLFFNWKFRD